MQFEPLSIEGAFRVRIEPLADERGFFARTYCRREFGALGISGTVVQTSLSYNARSGTVRGMHMQWPPSEESKLVRCVRGSIFDVLLDLRPSSKSFLAHETVILDQDGRDSVYIPPGVAHGFQTLTDHAEVLYQMTDYYAPDLATGVRWNDPAFGIEWPAPVTVISARDASYPDFRRDEYEAEYRRRAASAACKP